MEAVSNFLHSFGFASLFVSLGAAMIFLAFLSFFFKRRKLERHSHLEFLREGRISEKVWQKLFHILPFLLFLSVLIAIAGPEIVDEIQEPLESRDIAFVLDASGSMMVGFAPEDDLPIFEKTRLGVAEATLREFIELRHGDRMAFVLYDNPRGYIARSFTDDPDQLLSVFNKKEIRGVYEEEDSDSFAYAVHRGTNTVEGLKLAEQLFEQASQSKEKLIILVSDLDDNLSETIKTIKEAQGKGIKTYIIGIVSGNRDTAVARAKDILQDEWPRIFYVEEREDLLSAIKAIDRMEKSVVEVNRVVALHPIAWIFVVSALLLAVIFIVIAEKFKKIP